MQQEYATLETTVETLTEQINLLQIEKDTEVEALTKQVPQQRQSISWGPGFCFLFLTAE